MDIVTQIREALPPLWDFITPMPDLELNQMLDEDNRWGQYDYDKGGQIAEITDEVIEAVTQHFPHKQSPGSVVLFYRVDGAYSSVDDDETAFGGDRSPGWYVLRRSVSDGRDAPLSGVGTASTRPCTHGYPTYVNMSDEDDSDRPLPTGPKYKRLAHQGRLRPQQRVPSQRQYQPLTYNGIADRSRGSLCHREDGCPATPRPVRYTPSAEHAPNVHRWAWRAHIAALRRGFDPAIGDTASRRTGTRRTGIRRWRLDPSLIGVAVKVPVEDLVRELLHELTSRVGRGAKFRR
jgi:hypothetical protein